MSRSTRYIHIKANHFGPLPQGYKQKACDVCQMYYHEKDLVYVQDINNLQNGLYVCPTDLDKPNPLLRAKPITDTSGIGWNANTAPTHLNNTRINTGTTVASAPRNVTLLTNTSTSLTLVWETPETPGASGITGYKIERESPLGGGFTTLTDNTLTGGTMYKDTSISLNTEYNYKITPINDAGVSTNYATYTLTLT